jgi:hypothetical protein
MMLLNDLIEGDLWAIQTKAVARIGCLLVIQNVNAGEFGELLIGLEAVSSPGLGEDRRISKTLYLLDSFFRFGVC